MASSTTEIRLTIEGVDGTEATHAVTPRPVDQFGYIKWAKPAIGATSIQDDPVAFALYSAIRALRRTGVLDASADLSAEMSRVVSIEYPDTEDEDAEADPTMPAQ